MKISKIVLLFSLFLAQLSFAGKVVVFDAQLALTQTDSAKKQMAELQVKPEFAKLLAEAEAFQEEMKALNDESQTKGLTWGEAERAESYKKMEYLQGDFKRVVEKINKEKEALMQALVAEGQQAIPAVLDKLVKAEDIDVVLRKEATFLAMPAADITAKVIAELNKTAAK